MRPWRQAGARYSKKGIAPWEGQTGERARTTYFLPPAARNRGCAQKTPPKKTKVERELYICDTAIAIMGVHNNQRTQETGTSAMYQV